MKALSLTRPWDYTILHLGKRIENRSDKRGMPPMCRYRGPLLLHAAKSWDSGVGDWLAERGLARLYDDRAEPPDPSDYRLASSDVTVFANESSSRPTAGGIVGRCRIIGHIEQDQTFDFQMAKVTLGHWAGGTGQHPEPEEIGLDLRWWMGGYGLILDAVEAVPFVACRGHLGLWNVPADVLAQLPEAT